MQDATKVDQAASITKQKGERKASKGETFYRKSRQYRGLQNGRNSKNHSRHFQVATFAVLRDLLSLRLEKALQYVQHSTPDRIPLLPACYPCRSTSGLILSFVLGSTRFCCCGPCGPAFQGDDNITRTHPLVKKLTQRIRQRPLQFLGRPRLPIPRHVHIRPLFRLQPVRPQLASFSHFLKRFLPRLDCRPDGVEKRPGFRARFFDRAQRTCGKLSDALAPVFGLGKKGWNKH